jgi:hypothetical protein
MPLTNLRYVNGYSLKKNKKTYFLLVTFTKKQKNPVCFHKRDFNKALFFLSHQLYFILKLEIRS